MTTMTDPTNLPPGDVPPAGPLPPGGDQPPASPPPPPVGGWADAGGPAGPPPRPALRRSDRSRVVAGVCGGLGEYFGVDPVLFRVLFATSAFFGGVGIIAYLVAWAAIPERGAASAPLDGVARWFRRHRIPFGAAVAVAAVIAWISLFSWWGRWPFFPLLIVGIVLIAVLERNRTRRAPISAPPAAVDPHVAPTTTQPEASVPTEPTAPYATTPYPTTPYPTRDQNEFSAWVSESRSARRRRRAANRPVRVAVWATLALSLLGLAIADAVTGIAMPVYLWVIAAIVIVGVAVGAVLRRSVWGFTPILVPTFALLFAFGDTSASLHDGSGDRSYTPRSAAGLPSDYRQAFGRQQLDLTQLGTLTGTRTIDLRQAAGQVVVIAPRDMDVTVHSQVRFGELEVDGQHVQDGYDFTRDVVLGPHDTDRLTVNITLADGQVSIRRVG
jgi:phage shock protein PspC (stress-responsive transcriptional regulator)